MDRNRISSALRVFSYLFALITFGISYHLGKASPSGCQGSMGCIGQGLGRVVMWLGVSSIGYLLTLLFNSVALFLVPSPRPKGRKIETAIFSLPILLFILLFTVLLLR